MGIYDKSYDEIFICFVTKAVHLEVVTYLTSEVMILIPSRYFKKRNVKIILAAF